LNLTPEFQLYAQFHGVLQVILW